MQRFLAEYKIAAVMHFAAASLVGKSIVDPQKYYINNVGGTLALLEAMRKAGCHRSCFLRPGQSMAMPTARGCPNGFRCAPINPYGASKWMIERMLADYRQRYGFGVFACAILMPVVPIRPAASANGVTIETHLIPRAMMALQGHVSDFAVFGDDYDTPDGTAIRDYVHVTDLATAHVEGA